MKLSFSLFNQALHALKLPNYNSHYHRNHLNSLRTLRMLCFNQILRLAYEFFPASVLFNLGLYIQ